MDPKVCGKLLTLHRRGNGVDVEALHGRIPLWQDAGKGPKMGSHGYIRLRVFENIPEEDLGQGVTEGPTTPLGVPSTLVAASWLF